MLRFRLRSRRLAPRLAAGVLLLTAVTAGCGEAPRDEAAAPDETVPPLPVWTPADLPEGAQGRSFLGEALFPPPLPDELRLQREEELAEALAERDADLNDPDAWIWVGRRQAYLGRYREAIQTFTEGIDRFPDDPRFFRHRGHRWITVRELDRAVEDLEAGLDLAGDRMHEIEPDGLPNPAGIPLSTLGFNLWYHLALAEYLRGDFAAARDGWEATLAVSANPDLRVAALYWLHLTLRRLGEEERARQVVAEVTPGTEVLENTSYRDLILYFRGLAPREEILPGEEEGLGTVTVLYGLGARALSDRDTDEARRRFHQILSRPDQWAAFGYLAAEAEVARRGW
jgi:tetratricopeptide (TPR) repeat protein